MNSYMAEMLEQALLSGGLDAISSMLSGVISTILGTLMLILLPATLIGVAYCFFGIKIFRVMLSISAGFTGGIVGALLLGLMTNSSGIAMYVLGFILFAAIFAALAWFFWKVFLIIDTFFYCSQFFSTLFLVLTKSFVISLVLGLLAGIACAVVMFFITKTFVMVVTAVRGSAAIALELSLPFLKNGITLWIVMYVIFFIVFAVAGYFVQYKFFSANIDISMKGTAARPIATNTYVEVPMMCKVVGIEGMYKGFEFDVDNTITFGRDPDNCNVIFPDTAAGVSRIQCQVMFDRLSGAVSIVDKFSSYGTSVNGSKLEINRVAPLRNGDVIMFGENNVFKINC